MFRVSWCLGWVEAQSTAGDTLHLGRNAVITLSNHVIILSSHVITLGSHVMRHINSVYSCYL